MKSNYLFIWLGIALTALLLIPANLFVIGFPEWVMLIASSIIVAALLLFFFRAKAKLPAKLATSGVSLLVVLALCFCAYCNPYWNSLLLRSGNDGKAPEETLTFSEAKADLSYMAYCIAKNHPLYYNGLDESITVALEDANIRLAMAEKITVASLYRELQMVLSPLSDAHTCIYTVLPQEHYMRKIYPYISGGASLEKLNGQTIEELFAEKKSLFCYEAEEWGIHIMANKLSSKEGLMLMGIDVADGVEYCFAMDDGTTETVLANSEDYVTYQEYVEYNSVVQGESKGFVYYDIDEEKSLALLTLTSCNFNETYRTVLKEMFTEIKEKGINTVAVDLRGNGGGDSSVANEFIRYLDTDSYLTGTEQWRFGVLRLPPSESLVKNDRIKELCFSGEVYLLTSSSSFSSAMLFAEYIKDNNLGTIIGEAPANTPGGFGDIAVFQLPNSGLYLQVSTKEFTRADNETVDRLVEPDIPCDSGDAYNVLIESIK